MAKNKKGRKKSRGESKKNDAEASTKEDVTSKGENKATCKDNNDLHSQKVDLSAQNSKKRRRRAKSRQDTSKTEAISGTEYERQKLDCSDTFMGNLEMQKLISERISKIESGKSEAKPIVHMQRYKIVPSTSPESHQTTRDENVQDSSKKKPANKSNSTNPAEKYIISSSGLPLKTARSVVKGQESANTSQNVAKKKRRKRDNVKSTSDFHDALQSKAEGISENEKTAGHFSDKLTFLVKKLFATRKTSGKRTDEKSLPSTSEIDSVINTDYGRYDLDCSDTLKNDVDGENLNSRSSTDECESTDDSEVDDSYRPVIFVTDKSTQTDPLQEPPTILEHTDAYDKSACGSDSDCTVIIETKETNFILSPENSRMETVSEDTDIVKISGSNFNSLNQILQSISQDFLTDLKTTNESFTDGFIKCLMN